MPKKIVILGGGTAGWMAANLFVRKWTDEQVAVSLIESPDIGIIGVAEGSTPTLKRFFEMIDVTDADWMPPCNATYKVNIRFSGWSPDSGYGAFPPLAPEQPGKGDFYKEKDVQRFLRDCALNFSSHQANLDSLRDRDA